MPLRITEVDASYTKPVSVCDHCGEEITTAADGNYHWRFGVRGDYPGAPVYFTHKRCCAAFRENEPQSLARHGAGNLVRVLVLRSQPGLERGGETDVRL